MAFHANSLIGLGRIFKARDDNEEAFGFFTRALQETPKREDVHHEVIDIYIRMEMYDAARNQYNYLEKTLNKTLGIAPSMETQALLEQIPD